MSMNVHIGKTGKSIPRPDISVSHIILLVLAELGQAEFRKIVGHPLVRLIGATRSENSFYTAIARLKRRKFIVRTEKHTYALTTHGEYAALKALVRKELVNAERAVAPSLAWDGRWRIVFFDVPETKRPIRDYIRSVLKRLGFKEFQRSMWISPHKFPVALTRLFNDPQVRKYAKAITSSDIDYDDDLRRTFRLA